MFGCAKLGGDCRFYDGGYCMNRKFCSRKVPIRGNIFICDKRKLMVVKK